MHRSYCCSDVGRTRRHNEDSCLVVDDLGLFVVADGMGGEAGGEVASALAVATIARFASTHRASTPEAILVGGITRANEAIRAVGRADQRLKKMGTTTTSLLLRGAQAFVGHVGDSRAYLLRRGAITRLSRDHSLVAEQIRAGVITSAQAKTSPFRNVITRCVGSAETVDVDVSRVDVVGGDVLLLCSDGLSGLVDDDEIAGIVTAHAHQRLLHRVADVLVAVANARGGTDNITVVVVEVTEPCAGAVVDNGAVQALASSR
ncbi:MAG TPA: Stp1/IreP family PP2C-type Ser/Thr phosphatase [Myxococcota bacterium]